MADKKKFSEMNESEKQQLLEKAKIETKNRLIKLKEEQEANENDLDARLKQMAENIQTFTWKDFWFVSRMGRNVTHGKRANEYFEEALEANTYDEYIDSVRLAIAEMAEVPNICETDEEIEAEARVFYEAFKWGSAQDRKINDEAWKKALKNTIEEVREETTKRVIDSTLGVILRNFELKKRE